MEQTPSPLFRPSRTLRSRHPAAQPKDLASEHARFMRACLGVMVTAACVVQGAPRAVVARTPAQGGGHGHDGIIGMSGLKHDSRDTLYRSPGGAVPAGTQVTVRLRSLHDDITSATARLVDVNTGAEDLVVLTLALADAPCFEAELAAERCDYWETVLSAAAPDNFWYRFIVRDGAATAYYADDTAALDGGLGAATSEMADRSYALMFYAPDYKAPAWARQQVIYQIFPDRFANGDPANDPKTGEARYADTVVAMPWNALPEGYCRNYADSATNCPSRFPPDAALKESPRGRDYFGGDLQGVINKLDYLHALGITTIYFNPIFAAQSNHRYDTADYLKIDPSLGTNDTFKTLVNAAAKLGMRIILDGVFNHMSSDSPNFDRYHHYAGDNGACEAAGSPWRAWFVFHPPAEGAQAACAPGATGGADTAYDGWFGFDSIPVLNKDNPALQDFFLNGPESVARTWLRNGAAGWRLDVMGDATFPSGYWENFRGSAHAASPDALIIGELWQKDSTLLRNLRGDRADSTMNYRLRDAVLGLLAPGTFDSKGFPDSGHVIRPSEFAARIASIQEDYPPGFSIH